MAAEPPQTNGSRILAVDFVEEGAVAKGRGAVKGVVKGDDVDDAGDIDLSGFGGRGEGQEELIG